MAKCLACIVFSLFPEKYGYLIILLIAKFKSNRFLSFNYSEKQRQEYGQVLDDLKALHKSKKFTDLRAIMSATLEVVENQPKNLQNTKENVCAIIRLFYNDCFLVSLENIWSF